MKVLWRWQRSHCRFFSTWKQINDMSTFKPDGGKIRSLPRSRFQKLKTNSRRSRTGLSLSRRASSVEVPKPVSMSMTYDLLEVEGKLDFVLDSVLENCGCFFCLGSSLVHVSFRLKTQELRSLRGEKLRCLETMFGLATFAVRLRSQNPQW